MKGDVDKTERSGMLIVDMCRGFVDIETKDGKCLMYLRGARRLIPEINIEIAKMREIDVIIHVNDAHDKNDREFERFPKHCVKGTDESKTAVGFEYGDREVLTVEKKQFDAFFETRNGIHPLYMMLTMRNVKELTVVGICTEICVMYNVASAVNNRFKVIIPINCVKGLSGHGHEWALDHMKTILGVELVKKGE